MFRISNQILCLTAGILSFSLFLPLIFVVRGLPQDEFNRAQVLDKNWEELLRFPNTNYLNQNKIFQTDLQKVEDLTYYDIKPMMGSVLYSKLSDNLDLGSKKNFDVITNKDGFRFVLQSDNQSIEYYKRQKNPISSKIFVQVPSANTQKGLNLIKMEKDVRNLNLAVKKPEILTTLKQGQANQKNSSPSSSNNGDISLPDFANFTLTDQELLDGYQIDKNNLLDLPFFVQADPKEYQIYWILPLFLAVFITMLAVFCFWQFIKTFRKSC